MLWVTIHTINLWLLISIVPFAAALMALEIDLGGPVQVLTASYNILMWVAAAVALPSAPGFFGPYHAACWMALQPLGVPKEAAVALGTLCHAVFWVTVTATAARPASSSSTTWSVGGLDIHPSATAPSAVVNWWRRI